MRYLPEFVHLRVKHFPVQRLIQTQIGVNESTDQHESTQKKRKKFRQRTPKFNFELHPEFEN